MGISKTTYTVPFRRKRFGKTDYRRRLSLIKSGVPRLAIRKTNNGILAQIILFKSNGDVILASANSIELKKMGWNHKPGTIPSAYLTGLVLGKKSKDVAKAIVDIGRQTTTKGSRIYACVKGVVDAGIKIDVGKDILPDDNRIKGKHIEDYRKTKITEDFEKIKKVIMNQ